MTTLAEMTAEQQTAVKEIRARRHTPEADAERERFREEIRKEVPPKRATKSLEPMTARGKRKAADLYKIASEPTRLEILALLEGGEMHVGAICQAVGQSQPAVSHHLALLKVSGVVESRRSGKNNFYSCTGDGKALITLARHFAAA